MSSELNSAFASKDKARILSLVPAAYDYASDEKDLLWHAVWYGCDELALELIGRGAPPNRVHKFYTPLGHAAGKGNIKIVKALVAAGADLNARPDNGLTAIQSAASQGKDLIIKHLANLGADLSCTMNCAGTRLKTLALLTEIGAGINDRSPMSDDMTPLMSVCLTGKAKGSAAALFLLSKGANAAVVRESDGMTALKFALWGQCAEEVLEALVAAGCPMPQDDFPVVVTY